MYTVSQYSNSETPKLTSFNINSIGTGGINTPFALKIFVIRHQPSTNIDFSFNEENIHLLSLKEHLEKIRKYMQLSIVDLSFIFNVSRPTIYSWLEGVEPKPENIEQIQKISDLAKELQDYKIANIGKLLHRPILKERSMLDYFRTTENLSSLWALFKKRLINELERRATIKSSEKNQRNIKEILSESSTYIFKE